MYVLLYVITIYIEFIFNVFNFRHTITKCYSIISYDISTDLQFIMKISDHVTILWFSYYISFSIFCLKLCNREQKRILTNIYPTPQWFNNIVVLNFTLKNYILGTDTKYLDSQIPFPFGSQLYYVIIRFDFHSMINLNIGSNDVRHPLWLFFLFGCLLEEKLAALRLLGRDHIYAMKTWKNYVQETVKMFQEQYALT